ncbi:MAG: GAF domain-containing protein [Flavobacteriaceae bacterium]|nr:GAF domain-containing protein [Flavobacteriaceae bacterium]MDC3221344.1 GAF domain-containing protein [Flavobacteriaceae bacterium]MDG1032487.1 GAF domain-containing protein [Flavobacteriaceae bacterium]MDG1792649.1 GAF domain-containing protein [Flavobacteriaceae bacterium]MDG2485949.1 GAF domain-containing protein [Flavobacteriaceae bacterium]|tara:strand:+ start:1008 stop:1451 length:444 start_codon:yes stop_codon:yes gene_type:complete
MYEKEYSIIKKKIENLDLKDSLSFVCEFLQKNVKGYDWVGYYFHNDKNQLVLKKYFGLKTDHTIIPFGKGICGQTAESNMHIIVDDVNNEENYISCNINVKSEIVVPLFSNNKNIGQIDIDSNTLSRFTLDDLKFLKKINVLIAKKL